MRIPLLEKCKNPQKGVQSSITSRQTNSARARDRLVFVPSKNAGHSGAEHSSLRAVLFTICRREGEENVEGTARFRI
jgi:hypothetical protein